MKKRLLVRATGQASRRPLLWEVGKRFKVEWNLRHAVTEGERSEMAVELSGTARELEKAMALLRKRGAELFPIERTIFE